MVSAGQVAGSGNGSSQVFTVKVAAEVNPGPCGRWRTPRTSLPAAGAVTANTSATQAASGCIGSRGSNRALPATGLLPEGDWNLIGKLH